MTGELIKSFLVGLGFGVDEASLSKFNKSIASATTRVGVLYTAVSAAASGIVYGISKVSEGFEQLGYEYRIIAPAINKTLLLRREMLRAYREAGVNITRVVQESVKLNFSLAKTKFAFQAIYQSVAAKFFPLLTKQSDLLRQKLYANLPKIQVYLERFVKFIFKAIEALFTLGQRVWSILTRVYDFLYKLHQSTEGWSTIILGIAAAWQVLNLAFLATPLGAILAGLLAILALYDDFQTWKEGGESLFDWSSFVPVIDAVGAALSHVWKILNDVADIIGNVILAFYQLFHKDYSGAFDSLKAALDGVLTYFKDLWGYVEKVGGALAAAGGWAAGVIQNAFGDNPGAALGSTPGAQGAPLGAQQAQSVSNSQTNQHVQQQTTINVSGSADAQGTGKAVAGEQTRVNFDMVRNLRGATR